MKTVSLSENIYNFPQVDKQLIGKYVFDIVFSLAIIIIISPLLLFLTLIIFLTTLENPIYTQIRIGKNGEPFTLYKFRTMLSDTALTKLFKKDPTLQKEWNQNFKLKKDPRITYLGFFLRKTSLDELPQFFNVLKGNLSVVGPRPIIKEETKYYGEKMDKIFSNRPGITGLWQVSGRNNTSYKKRVMLDEYYIENRTFRMDLYLIAKTVLQMIYPKGAY